MAAITTICLDIAKSVFQVHGVDANGHLVIRRQLKRRHVLAFFQKLPPCLIGIEACATNAGASDLARAAFGFTRNKREGDDLEAINKMFAPEFRNRLDATITFAHLSQEIIAKVVEKFVLQLEAQLGDRNVTIELSEEASRWLIANGYDELMGARPMARVIQEHIKKPLADEVLFGHLKGGGHVRVIVDKDEEGRDKLGFQFLDGPVTPKPEKLPAVRPKPKRRSSPRPKAKRGSVPKVPLAKV